jgi:outer membrane protein
MQTYFGVDGKDSQRSGLDRYNADADIKDIGINLDANWVIDQYWSVRGVVSYTKLLGDASNDSPVVDEGSEGQLFTAVMAVYHF